MQEELQEDLTWSASRPATVRYQATLDGTESEAKKAKNPYEASLNEFETRSLAAYRASWPGMAYSLSQNGATGFAMHSSSEKALHTLIKNLGFVWSDVLAGWAA